MAAQLRVDIVADASKATRAVGTVQSKFKGMRSSVLGDLKAVAGGFAAGLGVAAGVRFIGDAISAASDLNETISKTQQVFGDASKGVLDWSKNSADKLGLSRNNALDAAASFAVLGRGAGKTGKPLADFSTKLVGVGADLASFNNTSPEEAMAAIAAGLRGESEPLRRYGILLNDAQLRQAALRMGLVKTTKQALTPQQRTLAAQQVILSQVGKAQGDFARTSGGLANQQRILSARFGNLKATIGSALLPATLLAVTALTSFGSAIGKVAGFVSRNIDVLKPLAILVGVVAIALGASAIVTNASAIALGLYRTAVTIARVAQLNFNVAVALFPGVLIVLAIAAVVAAIIILWQRSQTFRTIVLGVWRAVQSAFNAAKGVLLSGFGALRTGFSAVASVFNAVRGRIAAALSGVRAAMSAVGAAISRSVGSIRSVVSTVYAAITNPFRSALSVARSVVSGGMSSVVGYVRNVPGRVSSALGSVASRLVAPFRDGAARIRSAVDGVLGWVRGKFSSLAGIVSRPLSVVRGLYNGFARRWNSVSVNVPGVKVLGKQVVPGFGFGLPNIPMMATGAYVDRATLAVIGEGRSPEVVAPEPMLRRIVREESGPTVHVTLNVPPTANPAETGRAVVNAIRAYERAAGRSWRAAS